MSIGMATLILGAVTAAISAAVTVYGRRGSSPDSQATLVTASTLLLQQLQDRVLKLENRVAVVEAENEKHEATIAEYMRLYGPLPPY